MGCAVLSLVKNGLVHFFGQFLRLLSVFFNEDIELASYCP